MDYVFHRLQYLPIFIPGSRINTTVADESDGVREETVSSVVLSDDNRAGLMYRSQEALRRTSCRLRQPGPLTRPAFEFPY